MNRSPDPIVEASDGFTVQEAAEMTGLSAHNLRFYERAGLIGPIGRRQSSQHRRFTQRDLAKVETVACLRAAGMPLDQMRRYFELVEVVTRRSPRHAPRRSPKRSPQRSPQRELLEEHREVLHERLRAMQDHLDYLEHKIAFWRAKEEGDDETAATIASELSRRYKAGRVRGEEQPGP